MNWIKQKTSGRLLGATAALVFLVASIQMLMKNEPFYSWYYCFAWWSYIVVTECFLLSRGGFAPLFHDTKRFLVQLPLSITVWLIFEAFNFRLENWDYIELVAEKEFRWFGYSLSFATVLPGLFATQKLLDHLGVAKNARCLPLKNAKGLYKPFLFIGSVCVVAPLLWPHLFFPLVWLAFTFLLEPLNHRFNGVSLLKDWERGSPRQFYLLLLSGLWCGFLWELWNFWAGSKWFYTVPYVGFLKIFEMPILGFLGFPPFAVECYVMTNCFFLLWDRMKERLLPERLKMAWLALATTMIIFDVLMFWELIA